tara:strand:+ start:100 stop:1194 length:1095 start_codon:yes stop_codon:yes gene_type:complete
MHRIASTAMPEQVNVTEIAMFYMNTELSRLDAFCFKCNREVPICGKERNIANATRACEAHFCKPTRLDCKAAAAAGPAVAVAMIPAPHAYGIAYDFAQYKHEEEQRQKRIETLYPLVKQAKDSRIEPFDDRLRRFMFMREKDYNANKRDILLENDKLKEQVLLLTTQLAAATAGAVPDAHPRTLTPEPLKEVAVTLPPRVMDALIPRIVITEMTAPVKPKKPIKRRVATPPPDSDSDESEDDSPPPPRLRTPAVAVAAAVALPMTELNFYFYRGECDTEHGDEDCDCMFEEPSSSDDCSIGFSLFASHYKTAKGWNVTESVKQWDRLIQTVDSEYNGRVNVASLDYLESITDGAIFEWCDEMIQ